MRTYRLTSTIVVEANVRAESFESAKDKLERTLASTMCWQAWGEENPMAIRWVTRYPVVTSTEWIRQIDAEASRAQRRPFPDEGDGS